MVRIEQQHEHDRLDVLVRRIAAELGLHLDVEGWARRTYTVLSKADDRGRRQRLARVESHAVSDGTVRVYDDAGLPFAERVAAALEQEFEVAEAVIARARPED